VARQSTQRKIVMSETSAVLPGNSKTFRKHKPCSEASRSRVLLCTTRILFILVRIYSVFQRSTKEDIELVIRIPIRRMSRDNKIQIIIIIIIKNTIHKEYIPGLYKEM
jgi:hypothetical protein